MASAWLSGDPSDPDRWLAAAAAAADPARAEPLIEEALTLDPGHRGALVALGRARAALGLHAEAIALLERARDADPTDAIGLDAAVALADLRGDVGLARSAWTAHPGDADAALAVARWTHDPAEADRVLAEVTTPDPRVLALRTERALRAGDVAAARQAWDALHAVAPHGSAEGLGRWLGCLRSGTVTSDQLRGLWDTRRRALSTVPPAVGEVAERVRAVPTCAAARALLAATEGAEVAVAELQEAVTLAPDDSGLRLALGRALIDDGRPAEAVPWLESAAAARPFAPPIDLARALRGSGELDRARATLDVAAPAFPYDIALAVLRADLAPDRPTELAVLVDAAARTLDPALLARARALAADLDAGEALITALRGPDPLPPRMDEVSEVVVVVAKDSDARLQALVDRMTELGYSEPNELRNGDLVFSSPYVSRPAVTLHPDGSFDVQRSGMVLIKATPGASSGGSTTGVPDAPLIPRIISERKLRGYRDRLMNEIRPDLVAWREALCTEGFEDRLLVEVPAVLDRVWRDGVGRSGETLPTPEARRAELLEYWVTRTCTAEGDAVRTLIARFLRQEVQPSAWPVTAAEVAAVDADRRCEDTLAVALADL